MKKVLLACHTKQNEEVLKSMLSRLGALKCSVNNLNLSCRSSCRRTSKHMGVSVIQRPLERAMTCLRRSPDGVLARGSAPPQRPTRIPWGAVDGACHGRSTTRIILSWAAEGRGVCPMWLAAGCKSQRTMPKRE